MKNWIFLIISLYAGQLMAQPDNPANWNFFKGIGQVNTHAETGSEIWLGTENGLVIVNKETLEREFINRFNSNLPDDDIKSIVFDADGTAFIGTYDYVLARQSGSDWIEIEIPVDETIINNQAPKLFDIEIASDGSIWVATNNGLWHQKDGNWTVINANTSGLPTQFFGEVWGVEEDASGDIWFFSFELFRLSDGNIENISEGDNAIINFYAGGHLESRNGKMKVSNGFSFVAEIEGDSIRIADESTISFPGVSLWMMALDTEENINLIFQYGEQYIFDWETFLPVSNNLSEMLSNNYSTSTFSPVQDYFFDAEGRAWAAQRSNIFKSENEIISNTWLNTTPLISNNYNKFAEAPDGYTYILDSYHNLVKYHPDFGWEPLALPDFGGYYGIYNLSFDDQGFLWIGTSIGLMRWDSENWELYNSSNSAFPNDQAGQIVNSITGDMYVATGEGIAHFDGENWNYYTPDNSGLMEGSTRNMATNDSGHLWVSRDNIVHYYDGTTWTYFDENNTDIQHFINSGRIIALTNEDVWMTVSGGVYHYNGTDWTFFGAEEGLTSSPLDIAVDAQGKIWVGCYDGLGVFDGENWEMWTTDNSQMTGNHIRSVYAMSDGTIWLSAAGEGIMTYDQQLVLDIIAQNKSVERLTIFPNPATEIINISLLDTETTIADYELFSIDGRRLSAGIVEDNTLEISHLEAGIYILKIKNGEKIAVGKFEVY